MLEFHEFHQTLLTHPVVAAGPIPTVHDPDGVYPYPSFVETSARPVFRRYRCVSLENAFLRATISPDLGGKVHSLVEKSSGHETLFIPKSIYPIRILPRFGFIPGGIEVSFPISHSPVQLEAVDFQTGRSGDRLYLWCGERELHFGMHWTIEYSLGLADRFLTQRTCFRNLTAEPHPWMSWSNAAIPARADTEFHFPNGRVLRHGRELEIIDWATQGPRRVKDLERMTGFFWMEPDANAFGAFSPSLGHGLYHVADRQLAPGIKLWSYGMGPDAAWGRAASLSGETYLEIQGGPIRDQSIKEWLPPQATQWHIEYWLPSARPLDLRTIPVPNPVLVPLTQVPWFSWPPRVGVSLWLKVAEAGSKAAVNELPAPPGLEENLWAPSGMERLGEILRWAAAHAPPEQRDGWLFQLGAWLAARGLLEDALEALSCCHDDRGRALAGRLHLRGQRNAQAAADAFRSIAAAAFALHPQIVIERDLALAAIGPETLAERERWFAQVVGSQDEWLLEAKAGLLLDQGKPEQARALLESIRFQLVHQRYTRTALWKRIGIALKLGDERPPASLGEDDLAAFGAYREFPDATAL